MSYRPITDVMILTRGSLKGGRKFYGSYPAGFLERARVLVGAGPDDPVLHVCAGMVRHYKYNRGFGKNDCTLDLDPATEPDFNQDARLPFPSLTKWLIDSKREYAAPMTAPGQPACLTATAGWRAILIDSPYSPDHAERYAPGPLVYPKPNLLVRNAVDVLRVGGRVGILHFVWPAPPNNAKEVGVFGVGTGRNGSARWFIVFEKLE